MCRHLRTSIVLLALFVFQLYVFGLDIGNEDDETMSLEPLYDRMTHHQTIKRVPTNYRGKLGVRWRRQNDRGAGLKKMSSAHQNGPPLPEGLSRDPSESEFPFEAIYLNSNNSNSLYRSKEKHNKIGKNYRSWTEAESREVQSTETKNVVVKSRESVSVETNSRETEKSSEKLDDAELLNCEGLELCSSEVPSVNTTKRGLPDSTNRTELGSKEKIIANEPSSKRKERFFPNVLRDKNVSVTEVPPIGRHRGSIVPPFLTTESAVSRRPDDGSSLSPKKRRLSTTVPTSVSTEAFPQTMSYSIYNHFRPIDQEVPQEAIMPFLDFGRKLHQNAPSPSGVNSLEASTEHKTRTRHSSTTSRSEDDRLHDEMDVTLDRKTVERNNVPKVRVRSRGSSIAGLFRKAASASTVPTVRRTEPIDCTKVLRRRTLQNTDEYKLCLSTTENTVDNEASTDAHLENRPSNHKYSDEHEPPFVSQPKSNINSGVNYEIVNINNSSKSSLDDTSRLFHYEVEPSSSDTSNASEVTAGSEIATRVTTQTTSSGVPKRSTSLGDISSVTSSSRARADWTKVASGNRSPVATERSFGIENEGDSAKKSSFYSPVTRRFPTSQEQHAIDDEHTQRSYLDSSLLRTTFQQSPEVRTRLTSPTYQRSYPREESPRSTTHSVPILPRSEASSEFFSDTHRSKSEISSTSVRKPTYRTSTSTDRVAVDEVTESPEENVSSTQTTRDASSPPSTQENSTLPQYFFKEGTSFEPRTSEPKTIEPNTPTVPIWTRPATTSIPSTTPNYEIPGRNSSVRSPLEEIGPIYPDGLGTITYVLAIIAMVPLILGAVVVARLILGYNKKKVFDGSEYSSEYNRSPLEINGLVTSSPMTTKLPRVPQHLGWEMEKTGGLTIIPTPSSKWEFPRDKLRLQTVLGQGNFGQVWKAEADDLSGHAGLTRLVAVKTVKEGAQSKEREDLLRELGIMQDLGSHPNVVQLLGCCTEKEPYLLIMEYVMYGKLLSFLRDQRTRAQYYNFSDNGENLSSRDLTVFAYCVARGMDYLVSKGIIHRDLAARNVLVDHNKLCKIADFGMSRNVRDTGKHAIVYGCNKGLFRMTNFTA